MKKTLKQKRTQACIIDFILVYLGITVNQVHSIANRKDMGQVECKEYPSALRAMRRCFQLEEWNTEVMECWLLTGCLLRACGPWTALTILTILTDRTDPTDINQTMDKNKYISFPEYSLLVKGDRGL
jgi:hypothetical protein